MRIRMSSITVAAAASLMFLSAVTIPRASAADSSSDSTAAGSKKTVRTENRALSHSVRQSLTKVPGLDSSHINVLARGGTITLAGYAPDQSQIDSAQTAASKVAGVQRVDNRLTVLEPGN
ncbi:lipoprotein [Caballeronia cordobensis]|uniref:Lipoprotein n=2 Tax=Caballeronia cordobensis TaxID=1353886 RepID=A0A158HKT3_CABCO|nr:BON domain-containing protein [Caballeronia cordobensis]SAL45022.1 lipoprotein [Caballeronia cordobensis]